MESEEKGTIAMINEPISAAIVNRPKPTLPDRLLRQDEFEHYCDDLACWIADQTERYICGIKET